MKVEAILSFFAKYIESELGIIYAEHNYYQLQNRLEDIAKLMGAPNLLKLYEQAQLGITGEFKQHLLDIATNNETSFFRDPKIFKAIESQVLPSYEASHTTNEKLMIWSAASSTGQEALSAAMLISEWNSQHSKHIPFSITATDISERILTRAKRAEYSDLEAQRGLQNTLLTKYFKKDNQNKWKPSHELTKHIEFKLLNLKESFHFNHKFFLILCRNVLIYQSIESKIEIIKRLTQCLEPGGYLILGSSESLLGLSSDYESVNSDGVVIYRKKLPLAKAA